MKVYSPPGVRRLWFEAALWMVYALLIVVGLAHHAICQNEAQAWLIARDSNGLPGLMRNIRYGGHPLLWFLVLYVPAHLGWSPVSAQVIQGILACTEGAAVVTMRRMPLWLRGTALFSSFFLYDAGIIARNYMLGLLLLTLGARLLLEGRRWLGILALALAIQTHFLAIPVAISLYLWLAIWPLLKRRGAWAGAGRSVFLWAGASLMLLSLSVVYFTIRPPVDVATFRTGKEGLFSSNARNMILAEENAVQVMLPVRDLIVVGVPKSFFHTEMHQGAQSEEPTEREQKADASGLAPIHLQAVIPAAVLLAGLVLALRSWTARTFLIASFGLSFGAMAAVMAFPLETRYLSFVFLSVLLAFLIDATPGAGNVIGIMPRFGAAFLTAFVAVQATSGLWLWTQCMLRPFSDSKDTAEWIQRNGLGHAPLILENSERQSAIIAYLGRSDAYGADIQAHCSFVVYKKGNLYKERVTAEEIARVSGGSAHPLLLVTRRLLDEQEAAELHVKLVHTGETQPVISDERFFTFEQQ